MPSKKTLPKPSAKRMQPAVKRVKSRGTVLNVGGVKVALQKSKTKGRIPLNQIRKAVKVVKAANQRAESAPQREP